jgi:hypothetical protein
LPLCDTASYYHVNYFDIGWVDSEIRPTLNTALYALATSSRPIDPVTALAAILGQMVPPAPAQCVDTPGFNNGRGFGCSAYASRGWCANGAAAPGRGWTIGAGFNFPENSCCVCGKTASQAQAKTVLTMDGDDTLTLDADDDSMDADTKMMMASLVSPTAK